MNFKTVIFDLDDTLFKKMSDDWTDEELNKITLYPGVLEILQRTDLNKILVTKETEKGLQNRKIDVLGIKNNFKMIFVCNYDIEKKEIFEQIIDIFGNQNVFVVGDRIDSEIRWGNELKLKTILFKRGKYKDLKPKDDFEKANYTIEHFDELDNILLEK